MLKVLSLVSILFLFISCKKKYQTTDFRKELRPILERLSHEKSLPVSDTVAKNTLERIATKEELIQLLDSEYPLLRVVSYRAIVNRGEAEYE